MQHVLMTHNILRWALLLFGLLSIFTAIGGYMKKRAYTKADNRWNLIFMIMCDLQLTFGLTLFFQNGWWKMLTTSTKEVMKNGSMRFFALEHFVMMLIAWFIVHIGRVAIKRAADDQTKFKKTYIFYGIAMLIILAMIPWPFRQAGRALFPQF